MTKIKLCGLTRAVDIETANELMPEYQAVLKQKLRGNIDVIQLYEIRYKTSILAEMRSAQ